MFDRTAPNQLKETSYTVENSLQCWMSRCTCALGSLVGGCVLKGSNDSMPGLRVNIVELFDTPNATTVGSGEILAEATPVPSVNEEDSGSFA
jgi:hypothetical protein